MVNNRSIQSVYVFINLCLVVLSVAKESIFILPWSSLYLPVMVSMFVLHIFWGSLSRYIQRDICLLSLPDELILWSIWNFLMPDKKFWSWKCMYLLLIEQFQPSYAYYLESILFSSTSFQVLYMFKLSFIDSKQLVLTSLSILIISAF